MLKVANSVINASRITGVLPVANGGTNASTASITSFNNITGFTASGTTGTTSTNLVFATTPTLVGDVTLSTGNVVIGTAGKGIDFSADPSAPGMTSELLDDYEEGTWTPTLSRLGSAPSLTYTTQTGRYTKIGNMVTVTGEIQINAITSAGSTFDVLTGLPFSAGTGGNNGGLTCLISSAVATDPVLIFATYQTEFRMRTSALILTGGALQVDYVAGGIFIFSGSYLI